MKKQGFTLIELLAVLIILAIISLIAIPTILNIITQAGISSFKQHAYNIVKSGINKCQVINMKGEDGSLFVEYENHKEITEDTLKDAFEGKLPYYGQVSIHSNCKGSIAIYNDNYKVCAFKDYSDDQVTVVRLKNKNKCKVDTEIRGDGEPTFT